MRIKYTIFVLMIHAWFNAVENANFKLVVNHESFERTSEKEVAEKLYTFAWNRGPQQRVILDGVAYAFPANAVQPIMMNQRFRFERPQQLVAIQFNREFYCIVNHDAEVGCVGFLFYGLSPTMFIEPDEETLLELDLLQRSFTRELATEAESKDVMLRTLLVRYIILLTRLAKKQFTYQEIAEEKFLLFRHFNLLVEQHFKTEHRVQFYAGKLFKSPKTISNIFSRYSTKTPQQLIHERIVAEAMRLLYYSEKSMKEIAEYLGFDDPAHFSKFFKNHTGANPSDFKRKWQERKEIQDNGNDVRA